jgi:hypothetical protein
VLGIVRAHSGNFGPSQYHNEYILPSALNFEERHSKRNCDYKERENASNKLLSLASRKLCLPLEQYDSCLVKLVQAIFIRQADNSREIHCEQQRLNICIHGLKILNTSEQLPLE